jgi:hypothetical protein
MTTDTGRRERFFTELPTPIDHVMVARYRCGSSGGSASS